MGFSIRHGDWLLCDGIHNHSGKQAEKECVLSYEVHRRIKGADKGVLDSGECVYHAPGGSGGCDWGVPDMCRGCGLREQGGGYRVLFRL